MATIKTTLHAYSFDTSKASQLDAWHALCDSLTRTQPHVMDAWADSQTANYREAIAALDGKTVELETAHLFENQWNTAPIPGLSDNGLRVFDWRINRFPRNRALIKGHWLEQTAEMKEIRRNTHACGYCGKQEPAAKGYVFCPHCLDSEYLNASDLNLTRMRPVDTAFGEERAALTDAESAHLLPLYRYAQIYGASARGRRRIAKRLADVKAKYVRETENARIECEGFTWLLDRGINTDNVIYYAHTGRFCFGWRHPVDKEILSQLLGVISEFNYPYDIKTADNTLSGN